jgi:cbb3-type cytochrome oxidase subunit 1
MSYLPFLLICLTLFAPIFLPMIYWYILKREDSKVYSYCRLARRFWSLMIVVMLVVKFYELPQRATYNTYEVIGEFFGQILIAYLLWKRWKKVDANDSIELIQ